MGDEDGDYDYDYDYDDNDYEYEDYEEGDGDLNSDDGVIDPTNLGNAGFHADASSRKGTQDFKIIDFVEVWSLIKAAVADLSSLLECDDSCAQYLLQLNNWDKERIIDSYFSDPEKVKLASGIAKYDSSEIMKYFSVSMCGIGNSDSSLSTVFIPCKPECRVCYDEVEDPLKDGFSLGCGHFFCKDCFRAYLKGQVQDGPNCVTAHCPEYKCKQAVTQNVFHAFLSPTERDNFDRYVARGYIESIKTMRYCPAPNCEKIVISLTGQQNVCCDCSFKFCFDCGEETHSPSSCAQLGMWLEKCASDGESAKWIFANTKKCPKCNTRIEKNQGCNHMTCRQCKHEFCWLCFGNWTGHSACNRYTIEEAQREQSAIQKAKAELDRYLHYYNRYQAHDLALRIASKQRAEAEVRMRERQDKNSAAWIDVQFIHEAVEQVIACRRVLKYTYVIGFYMPENSPEKLLFERHQEMLEENTEKLHGAAEQKNVLVIDRAQVVNWTRITEKFRTSILDNFVDGQMLTGGENSHSMDGSERFSHFRDGGLGSISGNSSSARGGVLKKMLKRGTSK